MNVLELKSRRVRMGLTQQELANKLGLKAPTYNKKEKSINPFTLDEVKKIKSILSLTNDDIEKIFFD